MGISQRVNYGRLYGEIRMKWNCKHCNEEKNFQPHLAKKRTYCSSKCHGHAETQFLKVTGIKKVKEDSKVYNLSVDDDETYVAEDLIVHNCRSRLRYVVKNEEETKI